MGILGDDVEGVMSMDSEFAGVDLLAGRDAN